MEKKKKRSISSTKTHLKESEKVSGNTSQKTEENRLATQKKDIHLTLYTTLWELGYARAIASGALDPDPEAMDSLKEHASAMAKESHREAFDPEQNPHDAIRDAEFKKSISGRKRLEQSLEYAHDEVRTRELQAAVYKEDRPKPGLSLGMKSASIFLIGLTIAPTLRDNFFRTFDDDVLSWVVSLIGGMATGGFITFSILGTPSASRRRTLANFGGLIAGIVLSAGLALVRISDVTAFAEYLFAFALAGIELGIVFFLEFAAYAYRNNLGDWHTYNNERANAFSRLESSESHRDRIRDELDDCERKIADHARYVEDRGIRNTAIKEFDDLATRSVLDGYLAGTAENRGRLYGSSTRSHKNSNEEYNDEND